MRPFLPFVVLFAAGCGAGAEPAPEEPNVDTSTEVRAPAREVRAVDLVGQEKSPIMRRDLVAPAPALVRRCGSTLGCTE
jgi:hypothetical protein